MPKVIKMPMRDQHRKPEGSAASDFSNFHPASVRPLPHESDASDDMITRWINLADQALSNHGSARKRA